MIAMNWLGYPVQWYFTLLTLGLIFSPLTKRIFGSSSDQGYAFARVIGIIILSYTSLVLGILRILPFGWSCVTIIALAWGIINWKLSDRVVITRQIIIQELLFVAAFFGLVWIRGQEPSIHGLEKFMDYGFIQSILKSGYFPPKDMWYTPEPINYYYFGHLSGAVMINLTQVPPSVGYNLILATIFALAISQTYALLIRLITSAAEVTKQKISVLRTFFFGFLGTLLLNLGGNLHTIYLFTKGYPNDTPIPFWKIMSSFNPTAYWYPNATRFIPFTIHEFPSYSYVVADLHGHVFDIPFVLLTVTLLYLFFSRAPLHRLKKETLSLQSVQSFLFEFRYAVLFGFLSAVHYMTNAFDGPIYLLLTGAVAYLVIRSVRPFLVFMSVTIASFATFSAPFSLFFKPFATGIGVNCAHPALTALKKVGPFLFEQGNCQASPLWMMFLLWGQFWIVTAVLLWIMRTAKRSVPTDQFVLTMLVLSIVLVWIPEFFYAKDIYPQHFRANTMFKLGYQAFMMSSVGIGYTIFRLSSLRHTVINSIIRFVVCVCLFLIIIYALMPFTSFYGTLKKSPELEGTRWLSGEHPQSAEIVNYLNSHVSRHAVILEAQGDSYTDFNVVSSYTGNATVAGWWVHEWLWRGSSEVVQRRIPDIVTLYESRDLAQTKQLLRKYDIDYVVVTTFEREKYPKLYEEKFGIIGKKVLNTNDGFGALYSVKQ